MEMWSVTPTFVILLNFKVNRSTLGISYTNVSDIDLKQYRLVILYGPELDLTGIKQNSFTFINNQNMCLLLFQMRMSGSFTCIKGF